MKYNPKIVIAYFKSEGIPVPELEYRFHPVRKWRFDFCWPVLSYPTMVPGEALDSLALEVQGGIFRSGGGAHSGVGAVRDMEKFSEAAVLGWRIVFCQPRDLCMKSTADMIKRALGI